MRREYRQRNFRDCRPERHRDKRFFGMLIVAVGVIILLRTMGFLHFNIEMSWPFILIIIGLLIGIKSRFHNISWLILCIIGAVNLTPQFTIMGRSSELFVLPLVLILGGLFVAVRPRRQFFVTPEGGRPFKTDTLVNPESSINIDVTFGGRKEIITSKDFKGGTISATFAGCEVNMIQADFTTPSIILDIKVSFGGVELIIPANWEVQNEISPAFGSVDDERVVQIPATAENRKLLILRGSCSFGSVELKSY